MCVGCGGAVLRTVVKFLAAPFARQTGVTSQPSMLGRIPAGAAILCPRHIGPASQFGGQYYFFLRNAAARREVKELVGAHVANTFAGPIGCRLGYARAIASGYVFAT